MLFLYLSREPLAVSLYKLIDRLRKSKSSLLFRSLGGLGGAPSGLLVQSGSSRNLKVLLVSIPTNSASADSQE